jgi:hypothetical protein
MIDLSANTADRFQILKQSWYLCTRTISNKKILDIDNKCQYPSIKTGK